MSIADLNAPEEGSLTPDMRDQIRSSLLWSLWSLYAAEEALQWPVDELVMEMAHRPDYGRKIQEIFKMLLIERCAAPLRTELVDDMLGHVRAALVQAGLDASDALMYAPVNCDVVPQFIGVEAWEVNSIRPKVLQG